jgi:lipopolysaccharide transport system permease protein
MPILEYQREDIRLIYSLFKMKLRDRYLGSALGFFWSVLNPIFLLGMYTFVFGFVFKAKLPDSESTFAFAIWLISGFVPYLSISDSLNTTAGSIVGGSSLVKNIVFKSETLVLASVLISMIPFAVGMFFLIILLVIDGNYPTWHVVSLAPVLVFHLTLLAGLGFFLGATTVFIRDIVQALPTATLLILFFSPIFYTVEMLPWPIKQLTFFNPFYQICQPYREVLLYHRFPSLPGLLYMMALSSIFFILGLKYFRHFKGYFEMKL